MLLTACQYLPSTQEWLKPRVRQPDSLVQFRQRPRLEPYRREYV